MTDTVECRDALKTVWLYCRDVSYHVSVMKSFFDEI